MNDHNDKLELLVDVLKNMAEDNFEFSVFSHTAVNGPVTGIAVKKNATGIGVHYYADQFKDTDDLETAARQVICDAERRFAEYETGIQRIQDEFDNWEIRKNRIVAGICKKEVNEDFLQGKVCYEYLDFMIYFIGIVDICQDRIGAIPITEEYCSLWNISLENLKEAAKINMGEENVIVNAFNVGIPGENGVFLEVEDVPFSEMLKNRLPYCNDEAVLRLDFKENRYGGSIMERNELFAQIAEKQQSDLLIMPSADTSAVYVQARKTIGKAKYNTYSHKLKQVIPHVYVKEGKLCENEPVESLTGHAYIYSRNKGRILLAEELDTYFRTR